MEKEIKILIVDDVSMNRLLLKTLFDKEYVAFEASDGYGALDILEENEIDVIILDIIMPNMDGIEFLRRIKEDERFCDIPIIVSTEAGTASNELKVSELGVDSFITKPYNPNIIKYRVKNLVNSYILAKKENQIAAEESLERLNTFMGMLDTGVCLLRKTDRYRVVFVNDTLYEMLGYDSKDHRNVIGSDALSYVSETAQDNLKTLFESALRHSALNSELDMLAKDGTVVHMELNIRIKIDNQAPKMYFITMRPCDSARDNNELRRELHKYEMQFKRDSLTDLYNKDAFTKATQDMIKNHPNHTFVLGQWNLDRFKAVNELLGSSKGDTILREFANYLRENFTGLCTYGRLEADNFVTCCTRGFLERHAIEIDDVLTGSTKWYTVKYPLGLHVGFYEISEDDMDITLMCDRAAIALSYIKDSYIKRISFFDEDMRSSFLKEQQMMGEAEMAIERREFYVVYQPVVDVKTKRIISAEALVRWKKTDGTIVSPGDFIPAFEKNGYITRLDMYVWEEVCKFQSRRIKEGKEVVPISVNVSRIDFYNGTLNSDIQELLNRYEISPELIKLEITESAYMDQPQELTGAIQSFRNKGFKVMMDDFGSGYSSLNMLKDVSVDVLKIDMRFMDNVDTSDRASNILYSVIQMAKAIKMQVIAEGVETEAQYDMLLNMDCDCIQGYYFYRPMIAVDFDEKLDNEGVVVVPGREEDEKPTALVCVNWSDKNDIEREFADVMNLIFVDTYDEVYNLLKKDFMDINIIILNDDNRHDELNSLMDMINTRVFMADKPVFVISGDGNSERHVELYKRGIFDLKIRPVDFLIFKNQIRSYFAHVGKKKVEGVTKYKKDKIAHSVEALADNATLGIVRMLVEDDETLSIKSIEYVNERFLYIHQLTFEEALDRKNYSEFMKNIFYMDMAHLLHDIRSAITDKKEGLQHEYRIKWDNGIVHQMLLNVTFTYSKQGIFIDMVEIENQANPEFKLDRLVQNLMRQLSIGISAKIWRYYPNSDILEYYRTTSEGIYTRSVYENGRDYLIKHPMFNYEDRDRVKGMLDMMVAGAEDMREEFYITPAQDSGSAKWVRVVCIRVDSTEGNGDIIMAVSSDITAEVEARDRGWQEKQYWNRLAKDSELFAEVDVTDNRFLSENTWEQLKKFGIKKRVSYSQMIDFAVEAVTPDEQEKMRMLFDKDRIIDLFEEGRDLITLDFLADLYRDGKFEWYRSEMMLMKNENDNHIYASWQVKNVKKKSESEAKLYLTAQEDSLTGLYSRIMLEQTMNMALDTYEISNDGESGALFVMDIDDFKKINDSFGHDFGDDVLRAFAHMLNGVYDKEKYAARLGGDDFALFIPRIGSRKSAEAIASKIVSDTNYNMEWDGKNVRLSVSVGVFLTENQEPFKEAFPCADAALIEAKNSGKNNFCFYN